MTWAHLVDPGDDRAVMVSPALRLVVLELEGQQVRVLPMDADSDDAGVVVAGDVASVCRRLTDAADGPAHDRRLVGDLIDAVRGLRRDLQDLRDGR